MNTDAIMVGQVSAKRTRYQLEDGTRCGFLIPDQWNGILILDLDGAGSCEVEDPRLQRMISRTEAILSGGYAYGGTTREPVSYRFPQAVENLVGVREVFCSLYDTPVYTIAMGGSRGAFVGRQAMEQRPDIFDGAVVSAGGGGGEISGARGLDVVDDVPGLDVLRRLLRLPSAPRP